MLQSEPIAVLTSSFVLEAPIAARLFYTAVSLYRSGEQMERLEDNFGALVVRALGRSLALCDLAGPGFVADVYIQGGGRRVAFLLTAEGIAWAAARRAEAN